MRNCVVLGCGAALLVLAASLSGPASATTINVSASGGGTGINAISGTKCAAPVSGPALIIDGCLNTAHGVQVQFQSDENIQFDASGQAVIAPSDPSGYDYLKISIPLYTFDTLILNVEAVADGSIKFSDNFGDVSSAFSISKNGSNFFTITGGDFGYVTLTSSITDFTVSLEDSDDVQDTKQVRFDGIQIPGCVACGNQFEEVPEPTSLALLGGGLLFLGALRRRRPSPAI